MVAVGVQLLQLLHLCLQAVLHGVESPQPHVAPLAQARFQKRYCNTVKCLTSIAPEFLLDPAEGAKKIIPHVEIRARISNCVHNLPASNSNSSSCSLGSMQACASAYLYWGRVHSDLLVCVMFPCACRAAVQAESL
jgi:hypothetical protein